MNVLGERADQHGKFHRENRMAGKRALRQMKGAKGEGGGRGRGTNLKPLHRTRGGGATKLRLKRKEVTKSKKTAKKMSRM